MPKIRLCKCGVKPSIKKALLHGVRTLRMECACGNHGATLMYTKQVDVARMRQAAIDGWNLAG